MNHESEIWSQMSAIRTTSIYNNIVSYWKSFILSGIKHFILKFFFHNLVHSITPRSQS